MTSHTRSIQDLFSVSGSSVRRPTRNHNRKRGINNTKTRHHSDEHKKKKKLNKKQEFHDTKQKPNSWHLQVHAELLHKPTNNV